ncbi:hypothetical protein V7S43_014215 [Phytophthora oleae]|uniref:Helicase-associated domain-containing protein n=1 Tax=Phytophthora oleae TaxID=2107226 RepID=A0ABD3F208_9STRA
MLRIVVVARRHLRVRPLQVAPVPSHFASALAHASSACKDPHRRYSSSEPTPYQAPSVIRPKVALVWQKTVNPALRTYLELNNNLLIPIKFIVPINDGNWPEETWGYPLGKHVKSLRQCWSKGKLPDFAVQDLLEMDFVFDVSQYKWDHMTMPALLRYSELHGHSDVPQRFRIKPGDNKWPEKLWGFHLGTQVLNIRIRGDFKAQVAKDREKLARIEFCFESSFADREWKTRVLPSLVVYPQKFGNCDVPERFEVPDCPPWPKAAAELRLGPVVDRMRRQKGYAEQCARDADVLEKLGFVWDHYWANWNDRVFPALETFKLVKGYNKIPQSFVVPCTPLWPERAHGLRIGNIMNSIRCHCDYFDQIARRADRLAALGFEFPIAQKRWDQRVEPLLAMFGELHGHRNVPIDFVVPSEAPWKERDWSIQLGKLKRKEK